MIIVSDLDGTLLDHHDYSHSAADKALQRLRALNIPVILNTSKTRAELRVIVDELQLGTPYVVENGAAIVLPSDGAEQLTALSMPRSDILEILERVQSEHAYPLLSYAGMNIADLVSLTGLSEEQAAQSMQREFSEPLVWQGDQAQLQEFLDQMRAFGVHCLRGGRFLHLMGDCDKGRAMQHLIRDCYPGEKGPVVALGDSDNDIAMLERADIAVVVRSAVREPLQLHSDNRIITTDACGPEGWAQAINMLLDAGEY